MCEEHFVELNENHGNKERFPWQKALDKYVNYYCITDPVEIEKLKRPFYVAHVGGRNYAYDIAHKSETKLSSGHKTDIVIVLEIYKKYLLECEPIVGICQPDTNIGFGEWLEKQK